MPRSGIKLQHLAVVQVILAASILLAVIVRLALVGAFGREDSGALAVGGLAIIALVYYFAVHRVLKRNHERLSTLILMAIITLNIAYIMAVTGGLDSPYYSLWLLDLVLFGIVGGTIGWSLLGVTLLAYLAQYAQHSFNTDYLVNHGGQMVITVGAVLMAAWIRRGVGISGQADSRLETLSGQLQGEQIKSEVIMESVGEGILAVDHNRQIQLFNKAAVGLTGWDAKSASKIDYRLVLGLQNAAGNKITDADDPFLECWREKRTIAHDDLIMQTKGGHHVPIRITLSPIITGDQITGGIALFRDITADKEIQRQRDEFISTASHEMRTPVAAIEGYLSLAMTPSAATVDSRARGYLDKAHQSTQHLGELFRDLLDVTKSEDGGVPDKREPVELGKMASEVVADMKFSAEKKGLTLKLSNVGQRGSEKNIMPLYTVSASPQRMREVIMNLIENGIKYTEKGGITVSLTGDADTVTVSITDTGLGIAPEDAAHLFQKFYRVDSSATRTIGGTGLGLYLCRSLIERFGGRIWIESELGKGSSFKFTLPRIANSASAEASTGDATVKVTPHADAAGDNPLDAAEPGNAKVAS